MSEWPEAVVKRIAKELYISPVSDHWGETVPEISAVCERVAAIALDALGLREDRRVVKRAGNDTPVKAREGTFVRFVTPWEDV